MSTLDKLRTVTVVLALGLFVLSRFFPLDGLVILVALAFVVLAVGLFVWSRSKGGDPIDPSDVI